MRRTWVYPLLIALLMTLVSADVSAAKKSRSRHSASRGQRTGEARRGRSGGRIARSDKHGRDKYASRGRRGRHAARSRRHGRGRYEPEVAATPGVSRPQPGIPSERVTEIQNALIKAKFMDGPATGQYDDATISAVKQFQAANGLSQTGLPSAPLLKKLGVPKRSNDGYAMPVNSVVQAEKKHPQE